MRLDLHRGVDRCWVWDYFGEPLKNDRQRYPSTQQTIDWLSEAGFVECHHAEVQHLPADIEVAEALRTGALDKTKPHRSPNSVTPNTQRASRRFSQRRPKRKRRESRFASMPTSACLRLTGKSCDEVPTLFLICGLPGSGGKTTLEKRLEQGAPRLALRRADIRSFRR